MVYSMGQDRLMRALSTEPRKGAIRAYVAALDDMKVKRLSYEHQASMMRTEQLDKEADKLENEYSNRPLSEKVVDFVEKITGFHIPNDTELMMTVYREELEERTKKKIHIGSILTCEEAYSAQNERKVP